MIRFDTFEFVVAIVVLLALGWVAMDKSAEVVELRKQLEVHSENK